MAKAKLSNKLEKSIIKAIKYVSKNGGLPSTIFHEKFGCVLLNGEATDNTKDFVKWLNEQTK